MIDKKKNLENICTGCFACENICPKNAIKMFINKEGFYFPSVDKKKCIKCDLCVRVCKAEGSNFFQKKKAICYAAWSKKKIILKNSSSGGIFSELASIILKEKGIVFGAIYDRGEVRHIWINKKEETYKLRKSKYLPSRVGDSYSKVGYFLNKSRRVLFSGTPCQIVALYSFLKLKKINQDKLITCEVVCHGVPSLKVFNDYLKYKNIDKNKSFEFRNKTFGWKLNAISYFVNKRKNVVLSDTDIFFNGFLKNLFLKKACYDCKFAKLPRNADITLGDLWGAKNKYNYYGTSMVLLNSVKAERMFALIFDKIIYSKINIENFSSINPRILNGKYSENFLTKRKLFFRDYSRKSFDFIINKYLKISKKIYLDLFKKLSRFILMRLFSLLNLKNRF